MATVAAASAAARRDEEPRQPERRRKRPRIGVTPRLQSAAVPAPRGATSSISRAASAEPRAPSARKGTFDRRRFVLSFSRPLSTLRSFVCSRNRVSSAAVCSSRDQDEKETRRPSRADARVCLIVRAPRAVPITARRDKSEADRSNDNSRGYRTEDTLIK